jgi:hypothetical protein
MRRSKVSTGRAARHGTTCWPCSSQTASAWRATGTVASAPFDVLQYVEDGTAAKGDVGAQLDVLQDRMEILPLPCCSARGEIYIAQSNMRDVTLYVIPKDESRGTGAASFGR